MGPNVQSKAEIDLIVVVLPIIRKKSRQPQKVSHRFPNELEHALDICGLFICSTKQFLGNFIPGMTGVFFNGEPVSSVSSTSTSVASQVISIVKLF